MRSAIFTCVNNDRIFLPLWYRYYVNFFQDEAIFILDHQSTDGSVEALKASTRVSVRSLDYPYFGDFDWYTEVISKFQKELLESFDFVVWSEPDELIWHPLGLTRYIETLKGTHATCTGYEVIQRPTEAGLSSYDSILSDRRYWYRARHFDKTLVSRIPIHWSQGFHRTLNVEPLRDRELLLVHLHRIDFNWAAERHAQRARQAWKPDVREDIAWHYRQGPAEFEAWFYGPLHRKRSLPLRLTCLLGFERLLAPPAGPVRRIPGNVRCSLNKLTSQHAL